jgi:hypothetical protein
MPYILECLDKPGSLELRLANRPAHLDYVERHVQHVVVAGPIMAADETTPIGSLLILNLPDRASVEAFAAEDPYAKAGLFGSVTIRPWRLVFPKG